MEPGPISVDDWNITLPPKERVLTSMEELIHQFIVVTESLKIPAGEYYHGVENPKGEFGIYVVSKGGPGGCRRQLSAADPRTRSPGGYRWSEGARRSAVGIGCRW